MSAKQFSPTLCNRTKNVYTRSNPETQKVTIYTSWSW